MAAGATYEPIATNTLTGAQTTITFSSIPATYTDLRIVVTAKTASNQAMGLQFNGDTATNYSLTSLAGSGTAASSSRSTAMPAIYLAYYSVVNATNPTLMETDIFSYAGSTYKTTLTRTSNDNNGSGQVESLVNLWPSSSAINQIVVTAFGTNISAGTTATLYGIKAA